MADSKERLRNALQDGKSVNNIKSGDITLEFDSINNGARTIVKDSDFVVGTTENPKNAVFGGGCFYGVPIAFHFDYSDLSGLTISSGTDVTSLLKTTSGSSSPMFNGVSSGKSLLLGSPYNFGGIKLSYDVIGDVDPDSVTIEYLQDNSPTWSSLDWMVTRNTETYNIDSQVGDNFGTSGDTVEDVRFSFDPDSLPTPWDSVELSINGITYNYKWVVVRLTGSISTDPTLEKLELHTNNFRINESGDREYYGLARKPFIVSESLSDWVGASSAPSDQTIDYSTNISVQRTLNIFSAGSLDDLGASFKAPVGIDTSLPTLVDVYWYPKDNTVGDVELELDYVLLSVGDTLDGTATDSRISKVISVDTQSGEIFKSTFKIYVPKAVPYDTLALRLFRDGQAGNTDDDYANGVIIENIDVIAYKWK